jgi:hypothetical protein
MKSKLTIKVPKHIKTWMSKARVRGDHGERKFWLDALRAEEAARKQMSKISRDDRAAA